MSRYSKSPSELGEYALCTSSRWKAGRTVLTTGRNTECGANDAMPVIMHRAAPKASAAALRAATEQVIAGQAAAERVAAERIAALHVANERATTKRTFKERISALRTTTKHTATEHVLAERVVAHPATAERIMPKRFATKSMTAKRAVAVHEFNRAGQHLMSLAKQANILVAAHNRAVEEVFASGDLDRLDTIQPSAAQVDLALSNASRAYNKTSAAIISVAQLA
ncbi:hypothetical protein GGI16_000564 [Coemansia sp. S142-1]|nr:hypothetical protein GGI16_000564 [Coemansia sp. S142-1]